MCVCVCHAQAMNLSQVLYNRGVRLFNADEFKLAVAMLELSCQAAEFVSLEKHPAFIAKKSRTLRVLALAFSELSVHSSAFAALEQALEIQPANAEALHIKTRLLFELNRVPEAETNMLKTLQTAAFELDLGLGMIEFANAANAR
jgi:tetratricopeptide (TPR) repeat protein